MSSLMAKSSLEMSSGWAMRIRLWMWFGRAERKVLENEPQTPQGVHLHQMRLVDDEREHCSSSNRAPTC